MAKTKAVKRAPDADEVAQMHGFFGHFLKLFGDANPQYKGVHIHAAKLVTDGKAVSLSNLFNRKFAGIDLTASIRALEDTQQVASVMARGGPILYTYANRPADWSSMSDRESAIDRLLEQANVATALREADDVLKG